MNPFGPIRHDYQFPLRINGTQRQAQRANYPAHVAQMIRQFLLTSPGERINLPDYGAGLRRMIFAPITSELASTSELLIHQGLEKYLGQHIKVVKVKVRTATEVSDGAVEILLEYQLIETQTNEALTLQLP
jgi:phage baseplate assembly protein W